MVELGLVGLYLAEVAIVEIATILEISVAEDNHTASTVPHREVLARFIEIERGENISDGDTCGVALTQTVYVDPIRSAIGQVGGLRHGISVASLESGLAHRHWLDAAASQLLVHVIALQLRGSRCVLGLLLGARAARTSCRPHLNRMRLRLLLK